MDKYYNPDDLTDFIQKILNVDPNSLPQRDGQGDNLCDGSDDHVRQEAPFIFIENITINVKN